MEGCIRTTVPALIQTERRRGGESKVFPKDTKAWRVLKGKKKREGEKKTLWRGMFGDVRVDSMFTHC